MSELPVYGAASSAAYQPAVGVARAILGIFALQMPPIEFALPI